MVYELLVGSRIRIPRDVGQHLINKTRTFLTWTDPSVGFKRSRGWFVSPKQDHDIKAYKLTSEHLYIPRGFLERLELMMRAEGIRYTIKDNRTWYKPTPYTNKIDLYPHQIRPVKEMLEYDEGIFE